MMRSCLQDAVHAVLIVALSIAPIFLTQTLFVFTTQIQFETKVMKKESYSQPLSTPFIRLDWTCSRALPHQNRHVGGRLASVLSPGVKAESRNGGGRERALLRCVVVGRWLCQRRRVAIPARVRVRRRGAARLGDENRTFAVSLYHQTHCLLNLHAQLAISSPSSSSPPIIDDDDRRPRYAHLQHCLNYLRQQALCHPDLTLEPGDFTKRDFDVDRQGETHVCRDFETAWDHNTLRWLEWHRFLNEELDAK